MTVLVQIVLKWSIIRETFSETQLANLDMNEVMLEYLQIMLWRFTCTTNLIVN